MFVNIGLKAPKSPPVNNKVVGGFGLFEHNLFTLFSKR